MENFVYGIDFGTSTTLLAVQDLAEPRVIPIGTLGTKWIPSIVAIDTDSKVYSGNEAANFGNDDLKIRSPKNAITKNKDELTSPGGTSISADEAIVSILRQVKNKADELGLDPTGKGMVRMSCPAMWTGEQRSRLAKLAVRAGINTDVDNILDEPIAAAVAWWWNNFFKRKRKITAKIVVFDLGGGTLDVAVAEVYGEFLPEITVLAARGINIAGDNLDIALSDFYEAQVLEVHGVSMKESADYQSIRNIILNRAKEVKEELSTVENSKFDFSASVFSKLLPSLEISRRELESIYKKDLDQALSCVRLTLKESYLKTHNMNSVEMRNFLAMEFAKIAADVQYVVLAGGMSQIPIIKEELQKLFIQATIEHVNEDYEAVEAIVKGVASREDFRNLNIHRPNFNFYIRWQNKQGKWFEHLMYSAFSPLYADSDIAQGKFLLSHVCTWVPPNDIKGQIVDIELLSIGDRTVQLSVEGQSLASIKLKVASGIEIRSAIYLNGKISISQNGTFEKSFRVKQWPFIRWTNDPLRQNKLEITEYRGSTDFGVEETIYYGARSEKRTDYT